MKQNILITGISTGIGKFITENLKNQFNIYGVSRRNPKIETVNFTSLDLTDFKKTFEYIKSLKGIDFELIIFNAGVGFFDKIENLGDEEIIETFNLNIISPILFIKKLIPELNKKTKIIFIGSVAGKKFFKNGSVYQASKFALRGFVGSLKNEIKNPIFLINPGYVDTPNFYKNYRIEVNGKFRETKIEEILKTVKNIIDGDENRFEIDL